MPRARALVVYYSLTGHARSVAAAIAGRIGGELLELRDMRPRRGPLGHLRSGLEAVLRRRAAIAPVETDPSAYDLVVCVGQIWVGNLSSPTRTFLADHGARCARLAFVLTHGGGPSERAFRQMAELAGREPVATLAIRDEDLAARRHEVALDGFCGQLAPVAAGPERPEPMAVVSHALQPGRRPTMGGAGR